jgi:hypothetical protein
MSSYQQFVSEHIRNAPGANQREKMANVAAMWRKHKAQRGQGMAAMQGGAAAKKPAMKGGEVMLQGGAVRRPRKMRVAAVAPSSLRGGAVDPALALGASNELAGEGIFDIIGAPFKAIGHLVGAGMEDEDEPALEGGSWKKAGQVVGTLAPIAGLAAMML